MEHIAVIHTAFREKFGIPRQAGLAPSLRAKVVFSPAYRNPDALRGIEGFSHLWLLWEFSESLGHPWSPTVRPPRLGGNRRLGVFATRSPFRPNPIGLSCVKLEAVKQTAEYGTVLIVSGADLMDGTPIYDIKPYLPYCDCVPEAVGGFASTLPERLNVELSPSFSAQLPPETREALVEVLSQDPRPHYQNDPDRVYGMTFSGYQVRFSVRDGVLTVREMTKE